MPLDKELYRWAHELYRQWNDAELVDNIAQASNLSPQERWRHYVDLWEFAMRISPPPSELQERQSVTELNDYFLKLQKFEAWRRQRGEAA